MIKKIEKHNLIWSVRDKTSDEIIIGYVPGPVEYFNFLDIKPGDVVLDVGMNIGGFAVTAASKGAKVIGYEPHPETYELALENLKNNNLTAITHMAGVSGYDRDAKLYLDKPERNYSGFFTTIAEGLQGENEKKESIPIKLEGINGILEKYKPNKIKMDCEGAEWDIIMAIKDWYNVEKMVFEYHIVPGHDIVVMNDIIHYDDDKVYQNAFFKRLKEHFSKVEWHEQCKHIVNCEK